MCLYPLNMLPAPYCMASCPFDSGADALGTPMAGSSAQQAAKLRQLRQALQESEAAQREHACEALALREQLSATCAIPDTPGRPAAWMRTHATLALVLAGRQS